jgi:hypothetical protein
VRLGEPQAPPSPVDESLLKISKSTGGSNFPGLDFGYTALEAPPSDSINVGPPVMCLILDHSACLTLDYLV